MTVKNYIEHFLLRKWSMSLTKERLHYFVCFGLYKSVVFNFLKILRHDYKRPMS